MDELLLTTPSGSYA